MTDNQSRTIEDIKAKALPLFKKYNVRQAGVFGSTARGDYNYASDIDILVSFPQHAGVSLLEVGGLKIDLEEALGRSVDLTQYEAIKPQLRDSILEHEIRIL